MDGDLSKWEFVKIAQPQILDHAGYSTSDNYFVLKTGGELEGEVYADAEYYNASIQAWEQLPPMNYPRSGHLQLTLPNNNILVIGGKPADNDDMPLIGFCFAEIYDVANGFWKLVDHLDFLSGTIVGTVWSRTKVLLYGNETDTFYLYDFESSAISSAPCSMPRLSREQQVCDMIPAIEGLEVSGVNVVVQHLQDYNSTVSVVSIDSEWQIATLASVRIPSYHMPQVCSWPDGKFLLYFTLLGSVVVPTGIKSVCARKPMYRYDPEALEFIPLAGLPHYHNFPDTTFIPVNRNQLMIICVDENTASGMKSKTELCGIARTPKYRVLSPEKLQIVQEQALLLERILPKFHQGQEAIEKNRYLQQELLLAEGNRHRVQNLQDEREQLQRTIIELEAELDDWEQSAEHPHIGVLMENAHLADAGIHSLNREVALLRERLQEAQRDVSENSIQPAQARLEALDSALGDHPKAQAMKCPICCNVMLKSTSRDPVLLKPCICQTLCRECAIREMNGNGLCPFCRTPIQKMVENRALSEVIEAQT